MKLRTENKSLKINDLVRTSSIMLNPELMMDLSFSFMLLCSLLATTNQETRSWRDLTTSSNN